MNPHPPFDKVQIIEHSLRCFCCGLIGILPGIGLPFAIIALGDCLFVWRRQRGDWNPAEGYLRIGAAAALAGLLLTLLLAGVIMIEVGR